MSEEPNTHISVEEISELSQFEGLIEGLMKQGFGSCENFLTESTLVGLRANMAVLLSDGKMKPAGIGNKQKVQTNLLVRNDTISWLEPISSNAFEMVYLTKVQHFINHLNQTCYTSINSFESHYANYEQGSFYKKHLDQFKNEKGRKFSIILYLNEDWKEEDGGNLTLYPINSLPLNISPLGGTLVFFKSDEMEHEVHPSTTRERKSIAAWFKG